MIYIILKGGLGNQMFQYAFARNISLENNDKITLSYHKHLSNKLHEKYELNKMLLNQNVFFKEFKKLPFIIKFKSSFIDILYYFTITIYGRKKGNDIEKKYQKFLNSMGIYICTDGYVKTYINKKKTIILIGYFQSKRYFEKYYDIIRKEFYIKEPINQENKKYLNMIKTTNSVCVHVRRTDYTTLDNYNICTINYFLKAIKIMKSKLEKPVFYIFSDDINWVKQNIKVDNIVYVDNKNNSANDLRLMINCKHFIISNSSFSWWAQYLSSNKNKFVISPNIWYKDKKQQVDLINKNFIKLDVNN